MFLRTTWDAGKLVELSLPAGMSASPGTAWAGDPSRVTVLVRLKSIAAPYRPFWMMIWSRSRPIAYAPVWVMGPVGSTIGPMPCSSCQSIMEPQW